MSKAPTWAEILGQIEPFKGHKLYSAAVGQLELSMHLDGPWEAAAKATEIADAFEDVALRERLSLDLA